MVSRNLDKLKSVESSLKTKFSKTKTRVIQADLSKGDDIKIYERIADQVKDLDVAIVVNNAGVMHTGYFVDIPIE